MKYLEEHKFKNYYHNNHTFFNYGYSFDVIFKQWLQTPEGQLAKIHRDIVFENHSIKYFKVHAKTNLKIYDSQSKFEEILDKIIKFSDAFKQSDESK